MEGIQNVIETAWTKPMFSNDAIRTLRIKISRMATTLKKRDKQIQAKQNLAFNIRNEVIFNLDLVMEERPLSKNEFKLR